MPENEDVVLFGEAGYRAEGGIDTTCPYCGVGCGLTVSPKLDQTNTTDSFEVKVVGSKHHPANFGRLCVKGSAAGETVDFEGRMLTPQIRGKNTNWDDALHYVSSQFSQVIAEHGPNAVAFYVSGQLLTEDYYVANKLMKGFIGSANIDTNSRLCMASAVVGYKRAFGSDTVPCCYEDLEQADLITIVGSNTAWAHPIVYQRIAAARKKRPSLKIVVVDPRRTATCELSDLHLAIRPGMDAALFNGLLANLVTCHAIDEDFIDNCTEGFESALERARALQGNLSQLAEQCDLDKADIAQWFEWAASTPKMVTLYSQGVNQSSSGVDKSNAIINCHLATGRIGKAGMGPFSITGQPNAMGGREVGGLANQLAAHMDFNNHDNIRRVADFWQAENMARENGLMALELFQAVGDGRIKAIWIMNTNPVVSMPDADFVKRALKKCPCVVVSDCVQDTDTTRVADVLFPAKTWGEKVGTVTNSERTISLQRPFMKAPEEARSDWWIVCEVAKRMGWHRNFNYKSSAAIFREHAALSAWENGGSRDFDISSFAEIHDEAYASFQPIQWPVNSANPKGSKRMFTDGKFYTPSGKAQFISITPRAPRSRVSDEFPFILNTGRVRDQWHTMTRTAKTDKLMAHKDEPYLTLHPENAKELALENGVLAKVSNGYGLYIARVEISETQRRGEVFAPMHWTAQYSSHGRVDTLVAPFADPLSGQPESKHSVVDIERYCAEWHGFILSRNPLEKSLLDAVGESGYWVKIKGKHFYRYEVASEASRAETRLRWMDAWHEELKNALHLEHLGFSDSVEGHYRDAWIKNDRLEVVMFVLPSHQLPPRNWLGEQFLVDSINLATRRSLLAGKASGVKDAGKVVCSCFGVGFNTIVDAIEDSKLGSVEAIGEALQAGTNCGSCVSELAEILAKFSPVSAHSSKAN